MRSNIALTTLEAETEAVQPRPAEELEIRIGHDGADALVRELHALEAREAARAIAAQGAAILTVPRRYSWDVARALDHVSRLTASRKLRDARRHLSAQLGLERIEYILCSEVFTVHEPIFCSYSGPYTEGQRLVAGANLILRVVEVDIEATALSAGVLAVEDALP